LCLSSDGRDAELLQYFRQVAKIAMHQAHRQAPERRLGPLQGLGVAIQGNDLPSRFSGGCDPFGQCSRMSAAAESAVHQRLAGLRREPLEHLGQQNRLMLGSRHRAYVLDFGRWRQVEFLKKRDARNRKRASQSNGVVKLACGFARFLCLQSKKSGRPRASILKAQPGRTLPDD